MSHQLGVKFISALRLYELASPGRPAIEVSMDRVKELRMLGFTWTKIAKLLDISRRTLHRHLDGSGLMGYSDVSDQDLDSVIESYKATHPNDGENMVSCCLRSHGIYVPRRRIRESIHRVDPSGSEERARRTIRCRMYHVESPNKVWHMDGNHKLIRWKFVIHGAVDGYSRLIVFLTYSTNNTARTVLHGFVKATLEYGLPRKLCTDLGGENIDAWQYMIQQHGDERCVIVGSSVHNERIERL